MRSLPPGRNARLWLRRRLDVAARAVDVLEQQVRVLVREERRLRQHEAETRQAWERAAREADRWSLRATTIGGTQQVAMVRAHLRGTADATVVWGTTMGVTAPVTVRASLPDPGTTGSLGRSSALPAAAAAHGDAVGAALDHAAAARALGLVTAELAATRRRLRALERRWVPRLERTLVAVDLAIGEEEREDAVRARWVAAGPRRGWT